MLEDRPSALLRGIDRDSRVLELGPSMSPMAPRSAGWDVTVVDHASQEELIEKYKHDVHVNVANIEKVDHVWRGGPLHEAVPDNLHGSYDVLIASHVIEHIPDPIGFFASARKLLHPKTGVLALAVPDKRWCFDALKQVSTTGQMLEAHLQKRQRHSAATRFDASAYVMFDGNRSSWGREPLPNMYLPDTLDHAFEEFRNWSPDPEAPYVDCHAWHFTPASFRLNILELGDCGYCDWHVDWLEPRPTVEFFTQLRPGAQTFATPRERDAQRLAMLRQTLLELREQTDWLIGADEAQAQLAAQLRQEMQEMTQLLRSAPMLQDRAAQELHQVAQDLQQVSQKVHSAPMLQDVMAGEFHRVAETAAMVRTALRPPRAVWRGTLPLRRMVARMRGRVR